MRLIFIISILITMSGSARATEGVILLHGLCRTSASMGRLEAALIAAGYCVKNVNYPSRSAPIEKLSEDTIGAAFVDPEMQKCSKVHFVTHSMGGILVRSYFRRHAIGKLGKVVMLGPPNQGSEVVDRLKSWWLFRMLNGPAGSELGTDGDSTPRRLGAVNFELGVIAGDRSINWINSCMIKGIDDGKVSVERTKVAGMKELCVVHVCHPFLMRSPRVISDVIRFLKYGTFEPKPA